MLFYKVDIMRASPRQAVLNIQNNRVANAWHIYILIHVAVMIYSWAIVLVIIV